MQALKEKTLRGGLAKVCAQAVGFPLRVGSLVVMARLLEPRDFGLVGMVTVVTGVFNLFRDAGLSLVTVQRATITEEQLSTLFWINILVGALLTALSAIAAPILVGFYREPRLFSVTLVLAVGFLLNAAGVQHSAILQRQMRFTALAVIETVSLVASVAVGIGMALTGFGYWALVAMTIVVPTVSTLGFWLTTRWLPGAPRRNTGVRSMMSFGGAVTLNSLIVYIGYNTDKLLLGRFFGAETLGLYGRAYQLINIPTENLNTAVGGVALSALSRLQDDRERFRNYFIKGYSLLLALTVPLTFACAVFADDIVLVLLGPKWQQAATVFRLLAPTIFAFALINPLYWILVSSGHVGRSLKMALVIAPAVTLGYVVGLPFGSTGVAVGYSAVMVLLAVPMIMWAMRGMVVSWRELLWAIWPPMLSAGLATAAAFVLTRIWGHSFVPVQRLVLECSIMLVVYVGLLLFAMNEKTFYFGLVRDLTGRSGARSLETKAQAV